MGIKCNWLQMGRHCCKKNVTEFIIRSGMGQIVSAVSSDGNKMQLTGCEMLQINVTQFATLGPPLALGMGDLIRAVSSVGNPIQLIQLPFLLVKQPPHPTHPASTQYTLIFCWVIIAPQKKLEHQKHQYNTNKEKNICLEYPKMQNKHKSGFCFSLNLPYKLIFLSVRHRFNMSNIGPSNHPIIMSDHTYEVWVQ